MNWKDWVIGALWIVTLSLAGLGYNSIDKAIRSIYDCQVDQTKVISELKIQYEKDKGTMWRVIDRLCIYQKERLNKEGRTPDYVLPEHKD